MPERSHEAARLEGFSDAVFAIALTLLVVSLETPKSMAELERVARGFVPVALMFAMVCWIWYEHNVFFRRFGLQDGWTVVLNSALLFVVLFYVYPLKFLTTSMLGPTFGASAATPATASDARVLMLLYSGGLVLIFVTLAGLYRHAWNLRKEIGLTPQETLVARFKVRGHLWVAAIGVTSMALVLIDGRLAFEAGLIYFLIGPAQAWNGARHRRAQRRLTAVTASPTSERDEAP